MTRKEKRIHDCLTLDRVDYFLKYFWRYGLGWGVLMALVQMIDFSPFHISLSNTSFDESATWILSGLFLFGPLMTWLTYNQTRKKHKTPNKALDSTP